MWRVRKSVGFSDRFLGDRFSYNYEKRRSCEVIMNTRRAVTFLHIVITHSFRIQETNLRQGNKISWLQRLTATSVKLKGKT